MMVIIMLVFLWIVGWMVLLKLIDRLDQTGYENNAVFDALVSLGVAWLIVFPIFAPVVLFGKLKC